jgi:hypothetical protein
MLFLPKAAHVHTVAGCGAMPGLRRELIVITSGRFANPSKYSVLQIMHVLMVTPPL